MGKAATPARLNFRNFTIDFAREAVVRDGRTVSLRPQSFRVLCHLVERRGQLVTKEELFREVWGDTVVTDDSLTQCLVEIRKALGRQDRGLVRTLPRRGYIFEGTPVEPPAASRAASKAHPYGNLALAVASVLFLIFIGSLFYRLADDSVSPPIQSDTEAGTAVVAVLPFKNFTERDENDYLGYGLAEETLNRLTLVPDLRVIARTSSFGMAVDESLTMRDLAERLGATHVVEGSVRQHNGTLRITAQLIETATESHLWSESFDRQAHDLLRVQDEIASAIAGVLEVSTTGRQSQDRAISAADYDRYLRASYIITARGLSALQEARQLLEGITARNPHHLPTIEKLFWAYRHQFLVRQIDADEAVALIGGLARELAEYEPAALIVHTALGETALRIEGDLAKAAEHLGSAMALSAENPPTLRASGELAHALGRFDDAIALYRAALATDPLCGTCYIHLAYAYMRKGSLGSAERAVREFMKFTSGGHFSLALVKIMQGDYQAARSVLDTPVPPQSQRYKDYYQALLSYAEGDIEEYRELREHLEQRYADAETVRIAQLYAWGNELAEANDWAQRAADRDPATLQHTLQEPVWAALLEDERFLQLLTRLGRAPAQLEAIEFEIDRPALAAGTLLAET